LKPITGFWLNLAEYGGQRFIRKSTPENIFNYYQGYSLRQLYVARKI